MTTIAYRDGVLAADTLSTCNGMIETEVVKIWDHKGYLGGAAGSHALCNRFRSWFVGGMDGESPFHGGDDGNGLVAVPDGKIIVWGKHGSWTVNRAFYALGSGEQIAMGAMAAGASAQEAVKIAATMDTITGSKITVLKRRI